MKKSALFAAICVPAFLAAAPLAAKTLVYCSEGSPENFYPGVNTTGTSFDVTEHIYDNIVDFERGGTKVVPGLAEVWYDGVDGDCDGKSDYDQDKDGLDSALYAGTDCNDTDATIGSGATETWYDGVDQDCDGRSDYDQDKDGHDASAYGGNDCNDTNASISRDDGLYGRPGIVEPHEFVCTRAPSS